MIRLDLLLLDITALHRPICMGFWGNDVGFSTRAGDTAFPMQKNGKWKKNVDTSSRYPKRALSSYQTPLPHETDSGKMETGEHCDLPCCSHGGFYYAMRGLALSVKQWLVECLSSILSIKTLHSGAQYPWNDARDTLVSDLNWQTEDASVQIRF